MAAVQEKPKVQTSRKGKKAWRKNIDLNDVDKALEGQRAEERVFGQKVSQDDALFTIDTAGDAEVAKKMKGKKKLKVDEILGERSAVPAVGVKALNDRKQDGSRYTKQQVDRLVKRKREGAEILPPPKKKGGKQVYDMWVEEESAEPQDTNGFLESVQVRKARAPTTFTKKPAAAIHQPSVALPHPGASYNPTAEEHQELLRLATDIEERKLAAQRRLDEQRSYRKELNDLPNEDQELSDDGDSDEDDNEGEGHVPSKKATQRKTQTKRNKEKRARQEKLRAAIKRNEKEMRKQIDLVEQLEKELAEHQAKVELATKRRQEMKEENEKMGKQRLSRHKYQDVNVELKLTDELSESLRQLKPEGSVFTDRYVSMQKRNIIEPRVRQKRDRKYALKEYERRTYKNFDAAESRKAEQKEKQKQQKKK
ncbi:ribosome biogenesis protein Nop53/GLTSCR2 [Syncephalastrum racemosum]|uniref:Ribosome biogenesis protein NOP53 n=1 Tax=Syncephalastrum racemosum TaxID=13706 RepID=A0A1X2HTT4_SYNRA|nr:ribosome biogenesis protein Nop53/GLTSCR2 [Syncephalastrum racemosum]